MNELQHWVDLKGGRLSKDLSLSSYPPQPPPQKKQHLHIKDLHLTFCSFSARVPLQEPTSSPSFAPTLQAAPSGTADADGEEEKRVTAASVGSGSPSPEHSRGPEERGAEW